MANRVQLTLLGLVLGLIANALHLHSMYLIKVNPIKAGDTLIMRALVQCALFGLWSTVARVINRYDHQLTFIQLRSTRVYTIKVNQNFVVL